MHPKSMLINLTSIESLRAKARRTLEGDARIARSDDLQGHPARKWLAHLVSHDRETKRYILLPSSESWHLAGSRGDSPADSPSLRLCKRLRTQPVAARPSKRASHSPPASYAFKLSTVKRGSTRRLTAPTRASLALGS